jgi:hypothetical protein
VCSHNSSFSSSANEQSGESTVESINKIPFLKSK